MMFEPDLFHALYKRLIDLYPRRFREQLGESMEQTFKDLYNEKLKSQKGMLRFVLSTFIETGTGILREHFILITEGDNMQTARRNLGVSGFVSFLIILPFLIMEVVNRQSLNENFPFTLFFILWLNLFAVSLILLPILRARQTGNRDLTPPADTQDNTLFTNPGSALATSLFLILLIIIFFLLASIGWEPLERLFNGPNPEQAYIPGQIISILFISIPIAAGVIAAGPIVRTLRAGGSLFAHPIHLIIVVVISFFFATSVIGLIADQWSCFMGVPMCD